MGMNDFSEPMPFPVGDDRAAAGDPPRRLCLLVLGMHRSGTSALTRVLSLAGAKLPKDLMGAAAGNEAGHWESNRLVHFHNQMLAELGSSWDDWRALDLSHLSLRRRNETQEEMKDLLANEYGAAPLVVVKDPRICRFAPFFIDAVAAAGYDTRIILPVRNPLEVCESLERRREFWREDLSRSDAALLWLRHALEAEYASRPHKRVILPYGDLLADWKQSLTRIASSLDVTWPYAAGEIEPLVEEFLTPDLRHHSHKTKDLQLDAELRDWVADAWQALLVLSRNPASAAAMRELDTIRAAFDAAAPHLYRQRQALRLEAARREGELQRAITARQAEAEQLAAQLGQRDAELAAERAALAQKAAEAEQLVAQLSERDGDLAAEREVLAQKAREAELLAAQLGQRDSELGSERAALAQKAAEAEQLAAQLSQRDSKLAAEREALAQKAVEAEQLSARIAEQAKELALGRTMLEVRQQQYDKLTNAYELAAQRGAELTQSLALLEDDKQQTLSQLESVSLNNRSLEQQLQQALADARQSHADFDAQLQAKSRELQAAEERAGISEHHIKALKSSTSWKLTAPIRRLKTGPRAVAQAVGATPAAIRVGGGVLPTIRKAIRAYRREGMDGVKWRLDFARATYQGKFVPTIEMLPTKNVSQDATACEQPATTIEDLNTVAAPSNSQQEGKIAEYLNQVFTIAKKPAGISLEYVPKIDQPFDLSRSSLKLIAFLLPQFHPIPENDAWWGKGFTEWTNVSKAVPQFIGHDQPQLPGELGFYDLRLIDVQRQQIELARHYGIHGFCYHHYWFGGKRLLERPFNQILANPDLDLPFCLCWANENWTRRWDGMEQDVLMAQNHSLEDDLAFIADIAPALRDPRYIRFKGRPVLLVYRVTLLPDAKATAERWRDWCRREGIGELYLVAARAFGIKDPRPFGFDASVEFPPHEAHARRINDELQIINPDYKGNVYDYNDMVRSHLAVDATDYPLIKTACPGWDNEARKPGMGHTFHGSSPANYARWLRGALTYAEKKVRTTGDHPPFVFINAWNEWAEGAHLEPDRRLGYANLHASANVLLEFTPLHLEVEKAIRDSQRDFCKTSNAAVVLHLYYGDLFSELEAYLRNASHMDLFVSLGPNVIPEVVSRLRSSFPNAYLATYANRGRDMLPFLKFLKILFDYDYDYCCKVHAKKSPQRADGARLRQDALDSLLGSSDLVKQCRDEFEAHSTLGLVAPSTFLLHLGDPDRNVLNRHWLDRLLPHIGRGDLVGNYNWHFIAGSMFWFRPAALARLLELGLEDADFEEELGQVDGTLAHSLERLMTLCCVESGYEHIST